MDDKEALLQSIKNYPDEDLPRLMYADYLDENTTSDLDTATAQFIRISCKLQNKKRQYTEEGKWLKENWHRLVPDLHSNGFIFHKRLGKFLTLKKPLVKNNPSFGRFNIWVVLQFWKGFVKTASVFRSSDIKNVFPFLVKDQIFAQCGADYLPTWGRLTEDNPQEAYYVMRSTCPEFFDFVQDFDLESSASPSAVHHSFKMFTGNNCRERSRIAVSTAIRAWCLSLPSP